VAAVPPEEVISASSLDILEASRARRATANPLAANVREIAAPRPIAS
jgi:hypothetical protein